jgi:hypothetical protein
LWDLPPVKQQAAAPGAHSRTPADAGRVLARTIAAAITGEPSARPAADRSPAKAWKALADAARTGIDPAALRDRLRASPPSEFFRPRKSPVPLAIGSVVVLALFAVVGLFAAGVIPNPFPREPSPTTDDGPAPIAKGAGRGGPPGATDSDGALILDRIRAVEQVFERSPPDEQRQLLSRLYGYRVPERSPSRLEIEERRQRLRALYLADWIRRVELVIALAADPAERAAAEARLGRLHSELTELHSGLPQTGPVSDKENRCLDHVATLRDQLR